MVAAAVAFVGSGTSASFTTCGHTQGPAQSRALGFEFSHLGWWDDGESVTSPSRSIQVGWAIKLNININ